MNLQVCQKNYTWFTSITGAILSFSFFLVVQVFNNSYFLLLCTKPFWRQSGQLQHSPSRHQCTLKAPQLLFSGLQAALDEGLLHCRFVLYLPCTTCGCQSAWECLMAITGLIRSPFFFSRISLVSNVCSDAPSSAHTGLVQWRLMPLLGAQR